MSTPPSTSVRLLEDQMAREEARQTAMRLLLRTVRLLLRTDLTPDEFAQVGDILFGLLNDDEVAN